MYRGVPRLRASGSSILKNLTVAQLRRKASNSIAAVQDTFYSTKEIFEAHKVVFTIATSIASVATAWAGYTLRHLHESRVEQRLESIEKSCVGFDKHFGPERQLPQIVLGIRLGLLYSLLYGTITFPACVATAGTSLIIGYGLGWRGGAWYANRKFRKEQMKLLGQIKPKRWPLKFLRRPLIRPRQQVSAAKISEPSQKDASVVRS